MTTIKCGGGVAQKRSRSCRRVTAGPGILLSEDSVNKSNELTVVKQCVNGHFRNIQQLASNKPRMSGRRARIYYCSRASRIVVPASWRRCCCWRWRRWQQLATGRMIPRPQNFSHSPTGLNLVSRHFGHEFLYCVSLRASGRKRRMRSCPLAPSCSLQMGFQDHRANLTNTEGGKAGPYRPCTRPSFATMNCSRTGRERMSQARCVLCLFPTPVVRSLHHLSAACWFAPCQSSTRCRSCPCCSPVAVDSAHPSQTGVTTSLRRIV